MLSGEQAWAIPPLPPTKALPTQAMFETFPGQGPRGHPPRGYGAGSRAAMPGRSLPSSISKNAPPPVEIWVICS
jgi:hypothetical protein